MPSANILDEAERRIPAQDRDVASGDGDDHCPLQDRFQLINEHPRNFPTRRCI
jgi:hypothetical protein